MTKRSACLFVLALALPFASTAQDAAMQSQRIEFLMELMAVDKVIQKTLEVAKQDPRLAQLPAHARSCILDVVGGAQMREISRESYMRMFPTDKMQQEVIAFLESPTGKKLIGSVLDPVLAGNSAQQMITNGQNAQARLTKAEWTQIDQFTKTEAGQAFIAAPETLQKHRAEVVPQLVRQCVTQNPSR
jgi:hypothetical protein